MLSYEEGRSASCFPREKIDPKRRNVILSHQFYTAGQSEPETCDSEAAVAMAGGLDRIDISVLDAFDYGGAGASARLSEGGEGKRPLLRHAV